LKRSGSRLSTASIGDLHSVLCTDALKTVQLAAVTIFLAPVFHLLHRHGVFADRYSNHSPVTTKIRERKEKEKKRRRPAGAFSGIVSWEASKNMLDDRKDFLKPPLRWGLEMVRRASCAEPTASAG
jgi:hypothetical protein